MVEEKDIEFSRHAKRRMKLYGISEEDVLYIELSTRKPDGVIEIEEGINIDLTSDGNIVGIELIDATKKIPLDRFLKYEIDSESIGLMAMTKPEKNHLSSGEPGGGSYHLNT